MSISAIVREALRIGLRHKSLWLFGFLFGLGTGGGGASGGGQGGGQGAAAAPDIGIVLTVGLVALAVVAAFVVLKFVSSGALIEGVKRVRHDDAFTVRDGFREGWAHWGVLFRIALLYFAASAVSVGVFAGAIYVAGQLFGQLGLVAAGALAAIVGIPWLVTLYMWEAFAARIAVLENRRTMDAIYKARLFLHGRLQHGLKLMVASFVGALVVTVVGLAVMVPIGALAFGSAALWGVGGAIALGLLALLPAAFVTIAMIGTTISSVWTIGYLTEVRQ